MKKILSFTIIAFSIFLNGCVKSETKKLEEQVTYSQYKKTPNYLKKENFYEPTFYPNSVFYGCEIELNNKMIDISSVSMVIFGNNKIDFLAGYNIPTLYLNDEEIYEQFKKEWIYRRNICRFQQEYGGQND